MEKINLNIIEYHKLKNSDSLIPYKKIYTNGNDLYKIYTFNTKGTFIYSCENIVDIQQIERLSYLRKFVSLSHLPRGTIKYKNKDLGILYDYFKDYKSFDELYKEDKNIIFNNMRYAIDAMNELISFDIFNSDLINKNILYNGENVEFIDLDGPYVSFSNYFLNTMYYNFTGNLIEILKNKINSQYDKDDSLKVLKEIKIY